MVYGFPSAVPGCQAIALLVSSTDTFKKKVFCLTRGSVYMFRSRTHCRKVVNLLKYRDILDELGWTRRLPSFQRSLTTPHTVSSVFSMGSHTTWKIEDSYECDPSELCKTLSWTGNTPVYLTVCDMILMTHSHEHPNRWRFSFQKWCDKYNHWRRHQFLRQKTQVLVKRVFKRKRHEYVSKIVSCSFLSVKQIDHMCHEKINTTYLKKMLTRYGMRMMIARRGLETHKKTTTCESPNCVPDKKKICVTPSPWNVFLMLNRGVVFQDHDTRSRQYAAFVNDLETRYPDKTQRAKILCDLYRKGFVSVVGGVCLFTEDSTNKNIKIWILCSNRSVGSFLLNEIKKRQPTVLIDSPLEDVVDFYISQGFRWIDYPNLMIYERV